MVTELMSQPASIAASSTPNSGLESSILFQGSSPLLYGREESIVQVLSLFESVCRGQGQNLAPSRPFGVGKTSFARVVKAPVLASNGLFLEGNFDQFGRNVPFAAFRQVLSQFCQAIQKEDRDHREQWAEGIVEALGNSAQLLIDLEPAFESIIGPQAPISKISPTESKHRFAGVIRSFFETICKPEHPVVLFLDDWQWADPASLDLLSMLHSQASLRYLFIIAAYRDDEIDDDHLFATTLAKLKDEQVAISTIELSNLTAKDLGRLIQGKLADRIESLSEIVDLVVERTSGNPFFSLTFLDFLLESRYLQYDGHDRCWRLNTDGTKLKQRMDVVEWYAQRLEGLDESSRELLSLSACLGHTFDINNALHHQRA